MEKVSSLPPPIRSAGLPAGPAAAAEWEKMCRAAGIHPLSKQDAADLPPWTDEEAAAFARNIEETSGRIERDRFQP